MIFYYVKVFCQIAFILLLVVLLENDFSIPFIPFIDYRTGIEYPNRDSLAPERYWQPLWQYFERFIDHPESKFEGEIGKLEYRRFEFNARSIRYIGKETNNLERAEVLGTQNDDYTTYQVSLQSIPNAVGMILKVTPKDVKSFGISRSVLFYIKRNIRRTGDFNSLQLKTRKKILAFLMNNSTNSE